MNNLNNFNVFVINLRKNVSQRIDFGQQAESIGLNYQYFEGYDGVSEGFDKSSEFLTKYYTKPFYISQGSSDNKESANYDITNFIKAERMGSLISHLRMLKYAIDMELTNIIIMEDDLIIKDLDFSVTQEDAHISYLSGQKELYSSALNINGYQESPFNWAEIDKYKVWGHKAYIIEGRDKIKLVYDLLINIEQKPRALDAMMIKYVQKNYKCYLLNNGNDFNVSK